MGTAGDGTSGVVVSAATRGLVDGSGLEFEPRGRHRAKGIEKPIEVYRLVPEA